MIKSYTENYRLVNDYFKNIKDANDNYLLYKLRNDIQFIPNIEYFKLSGITSIDGNFLYITLDSTPITSNPILNYDISLIFGWYESIDSYSQNNIISNEDFIIDNIDKTTNTITLRSLFPINDSTFSGLNGYAYISKTQKIKETSLDEENFLFKIFGHKHAHKKSYINGMCILNVTFDGAGNISVFDSYLDYEDLIINDLNNVLDTNTNITNIIKSKTLNENTGVTKTINGDILTINNIENNIFKINTLSLSFEDINIINEEYMFIIKMAGKFNYTNTVWTKRPINFN